MTGILCIIFLLFILEDYDAIALTPIIDAGKNYDQTIFETSDESILNGAIGVANKMKKVLYILLYTIYYLLSNYLHVYLYL